MGEIVARYQIYGQLFEEYYSLLSVTSSLLIEFANCTDHNAWVRVKLLAGWSGWSLFRAAVLRI
jgi:hypothetical protein